MSLQALKEFCEENSIEYKLNEPMSCHTSFKIGGAADIFILVRSVLELSALLKECGELNIPRFIIGKGLKDSNSFKMFDAKALGLADNFEYLFPKSINRLRKKGSGAKFVHGGISLQEVIIPIIQIKIG